jgi:two-component system, sensor histidine kinase and response regulator
MNAHVTKPIDPTVLYETLARWIRPGARRRPAAEAPAAGAAAEGTRAFPGLPEALCGFDLSEGLRRLRGNTALYRRLLVDFAARYRGEAGAVRRDLEAGDFDGVRRRVHAVKGVAGNLSAKPLQAAGAALERLVQPAGSERPPGDAVLRDACGAFTAALELALAAAASLAPAGLDRPEGAAPGAAPAPLPEVKPELLAAMRSAAELGDVDELAALARAASAGGDGLSDLADRIQRMAEDFDFEAILKLVAELATGKRRH